MITRKKVHGTQTVVPERELNVDTVYLRTNIHQIEDERGHKLWEYDEKQLNFDEYFKLTVPQNEDNLAASVVELSLLFSEYKQETDAKIAALEGGN